MIDILQIVRWKTSHLATGMGEILARRHAQEQSSLQIFRRSDIYETTRLYISISCQARVLSINAPNPPPPLIFILFIINRAHSLLQRSLHSIITLQSPLPRRWSHSISSHRSSRSRPLLSPTPLAKRNPNLQPRLLPHNPPPMIPQPLINTSIMHQLHPSHKFL